MIWRKEYNIQITAKAWNQEQIIFCKLTRRMKMEQGVPKRRHINLAAQGMIWRKEYNIQITAKAWNQ